MSLLLLVNDLGVRHTKLMSGSGKLGGRGGTKTGGKVFSVVWLGKRGRDCRKSSGSKTGRSVYAIILSKVQPDVRSS